MEKEFVTYSIALRLKALGFDEPCFMYENSDERQLNFSEYELFKNDNQDLTDFIKLPTWQSAFKWFREKYNLTGLIEIGTQEFSYQIFNEKGNKQLGNEPLSYNGTYEKAQEACLEKLCEIVESKKD